MWSALEPGEGTGKTKTCMKQNHQTEEKYLSIANTNPKGLNIKPIFYPLSDFHLERSRFDLRVRLPRSKDRFASPADKHM